MINLQIKGAADRRDLFADVDDLIRQRLSQLRPTIRVVDLPMVVGAIGTPLVGGEHVFLRLGLNGAAEVITWSLAATVGVSAYHATCAVDVLAGPTLDTITSVCGSNLPTLIAAIENTDQPPIGWSASIPDPSWVMARVVAVDGVTEVVGLTLRLAVGMAPTARVLGDAAGNAIVDDAGNYLSWGQ